MHSCISVTDSFWEVDVIKENMLCFLYLAFSSSKFSLFFFSLFFTSQLLIDFLVRITYSSKPLDFITLGYIWISWFCDCFENRWLKQHMDTLEHPLLKFPDHLSAFCKDSVLPSISHFPFLFSTTLWSFSDGHVANFPFLLSTMTSLFGLSLEVYMNFCRV